MNKIKGKKKLSSLIIVFALVLIVSFVYAAGTGTLVFTGTASYYGGPKDGDAELRFYEVDPSASSGQSSGTATVQADPTTNVPAQRVVINATFVNTTDVLTFNFKVRNYGNTAGTLNTFTMTSQEGVIIDGTYEDLENETIGANDIGDGSNISKIVNVTIQLDDSHAAIDRTYTFSIEMPWVTAP